MIVVETPRAVSVEAAQAHWRARHASLYARAPWLVGYVQNRPLEEEWPRLGARTVCSETWFADRVDERASFASAYYREVVMPDEEQFLDRGSAWLGRVVGDDRPGLVGSARYRVLAFGTERLSVEAERLIVDRDPWAGGSRCVASVWVDDRVQALQIARAASCFAFAAEPCVILDPPRPL